MLRLAGHTMIVVLSTIITLTLSSHQFSSSMSSLGRGDVSADLHHSAVSGQGGVCLPWSPPRPPPPVYPEPPPATNGSEYAYGGVVVIIVPVGLICWCCRLCARDDQRQAQRVVVTNAMVRVPPGTNPGAAPGGRLAGSLPPGSYTIATVCPPQGHNRAYSLQPSAPGGGASGSRDPNSGVVKGNYVGPPYAPIYPPGSAYPPGPACPPGAPQVPPPYTLPTGGAAGSNAPPPSYSEAIGGRPADTDPRVDVSDTEILVERM